MDSPTNKSSSYNRIPGSLPPSGIINSPPIPKRTESRVPVVDYPQSDEDSFYSDCGNSIMEAAKPMERTDSGVFVSDNEKIKQRPHWNALKELENAYPSTPLNLLKSRDSITSTISSPCESRTEQQMESIKIQRSTYSVQLQEKSPDNIETSPRLPFENTQNEISSSFLDLGPGKDLFSSPPKSCSASTENISKSFPTPEDCSPMQHSNKFSFCIETQEKQESLDNDFISKNILDEMVKNATPQKEPPINNNQGLQSIPDNLMDLPAVSKNTLNESTTNPKIAGIVPLIPYMSIPNNEYQISDFDPLASATPESKATSTWMIELNTPKTIPQSVSHDNVGIVEVSRPTLLDLSPVSVQAKYTEEDLEKAKKEVRQEMQKEVEKLWVYKYTHEDMEMIKKNIIDQYERKIESLAPLKYTEEEVNLLKNQIEEQKAQFSDILLTKDEEKKKVLKEKDELQIVLDDFESSMSQMIADRKKEKEIHLDQITILQRTNEKLVQQVDTLENSFKKLRKRYEELKALKENFKMNEETLKNTIESLKHDVIAGGERYEVLRSHAEKKIEEANEEISRVRSNFENELSSLRAKISRSDLRIRALETEVESKVKENAELTKICDELISRMEGQ